MKRSMVLVIAAMCFLGMASLSQAKYVSGFKVIEVVENQVTIQKGSDDPITVPVKKKNYNVGDKVKYDADRQKVRAAKPKQGVEGC